MQYTYFKYLFSNFSKTSFNEIFFYILVCNQCFHTTCERYLTMAHHACPGDDNKNNISITGKAVFDTEVVGIKTITRVT